jgi:hypothetical protein
MFDGGELGHLQHYNYQVSDPKYFSGVFHDS